MKDSKSLIVITGASSGIGAATARLLSSRGYPLLLLARRVDRLQALNLPNTLCCQVDITDGEAVKAAIAQAEAQFGPVDALINNAGVMLLGNMAEQDPKEWQQMLDVNVSGLLNGIHAVLKGMRERKSGTIINISSIAGRKTFPDHGVYCGTKFAVHAITEGLREEVAMDNVRCITIAPGAVETELLSHTTSDSIKEGYEAWKTEMGGVVKAEQIAEAIRFAYEQPQSLCIREIVLAATRQQP
ncbi:MULTISPECIES: SDR family oxidoreductase [Plesiomonas]|uniref:Short-chain dehydrogenase/reductase SDR n=1 Tax=Plesiomonas shigelloides 302-73 TaxID=1315976 RepID=R8AQJ3_PLESH|nr:MULTISPECIES: SDR family oxidoreductase [Plesiomonas]MDO4689258.1 SDR family oxidoreductase [Plesiomonas sp.]AVQ86412.1 SDR family NAD(P)-dependent oxidoreductase [Plesiomonas shigelloides]EON88603.1 short-chain dehydrogenase/reductase SDR [Plesiomonas shigelloides 302-73]KAB7654826.1 SDR family NAD(P)-dependent oxidoreductase [Plesiomonas shigelloides]KAB7662200.1 SDR family NAD(P)-dependent oxidoreductase [Plesiomonas shigelloides]